MTSSPACPICHGTTTLYQAGTTAGQEYFSSDADYGIAGGEYQQQLTVYKCKQCGHGVTDHGVSAEAITAWYARHSLDTVFLADEAGRRRTARRVLRRIEQIVGRKGKLLDVGAGPGLFLSEAKNIGWEVAGIEPAASSRAYAARHSGIDIVAGGINELARVPENTYDVVTLFDVIEHVTDPITSLRRVARVLVPGGILVLTTPRFDSFVARLLGKYWYAIFPAHLHFFTRRSLALALSAAHLELLSTRSHVRHLSVGYIWQRLRGWLGGGGKTVSGRQCIIPFSVCYLF